MAGNELHVVTGAFGYSGKYIAQRLLAAGHRVRTLTNSLDRENPFRGSIEARPFGFDDPAGLAEALRGASVFYNTYWVRFNHKDFSYREAVENTLKMFAACKRAGVERIVHVSITNPSENSPLEYFSGKARLEKELVGCGLSHAILRPTVLFGKEDILINNIAWCLRRFPIFGVFGNGLYKLQPIYVDDLARLAVDAGRQRDNLVIDAIGPETFTFGELVTKIGSIIGRSRPIVALPLGLAWFFGRLIGARMHDVLITRDEIAGLMQNLLCTDSKPAGTVRLTDWAGNHADKLGRDYASELRRRHQRQLAYLSFL